MSTSSRDAMAHAKAGSTFHCPHCGAATAATSNVSKCSDCGKEFSPAQLQTVAQPDAPAPSQVDPNGLPPIAAAVSSNASAESSQPPPLPAGLDIGNYSLEAEIGRGGMGVVYRGMQKSLQRKIAVKVLPARLASDPNFVARFDREALMLATLNHNNIVQIIDRGRCKLSGAGLPEEICYLVMEFVEGVSLRQLLNQQKLSPEQALLIVPQICAALEYAHGKGLVHRDIKPENILLTTDSQVKITDFGLARMVHGDGEVARQTLTHTNILMGTPDYMAPEQREKAKSVDHRADIYSLGVIFYEMLTGELPLGRFPVPSKKVSVDVRLDEVILKSLEKEPNMRYQRASHVSKDVTDIQNFAPRARQTTVLPDQSAVSHEPTLMTLPPEVLQLKDGRRVELSGRGVRVIDSAAPGTAQPAPPFRDGSATYTLALLAMLLALVPFLGVLAMLVGMLFSR